MILQKPINMIKHFQPARKKKEVRIIEEKYYTCKYDRVFKDIFLDSKDPHLLKVLLESILKVEIHTITIQNNELIEENKEVKRKYLDALLDTSEGIINIEINTSISPSTRIRNFAYLSRLYANHTLKGEDYNTKQKFIQMNFTYNMKDKEYYRIYSIQDKEKKEYVENIQIYEFNMDKYVNTWYTKEKEKIKDNKYLIMMNLPKKELEELSKEDKVVKEYMEK